MERETYWCEVEPILACFEYSVKYAHFVGAFASWGTSFGAEHAQRVPDMGRALPGDRLSVGERHS
jgi:hypothetical protein